jgi:hypothetical protein
LHSQHNYTTIYSYSVLSLPLEQHCVVQSIVSPQIPCTHITTYTDLT